MTRKHFTELRKRLEDERGQALVEYALVIALVSLVGLGALSVLGTDVTDLMGRVADALESALP